MYSQATISRSVSQQKEKEAGSQTYNQRRHEYQADDHGPATDNVADGDDEEQPGGIAGLQQRWNQRSTLIRDTKVLRQDVKNWMGIIEVCDTECGYLDMYDRQSASPWKVDDGQSYESKETGHGPRHLIVLVWIPSQPRRCPKELGEAGRILFTRRRFLPHCGH